jgi:Peptidase A4 family
MSMAFWAGYSVAARDVTGVRAEWVEPTVSGGARSSVYLWVGIGSWNAAPVVQTGTYVIFPGGRYEERGAWYERYPLDPYGVTGDLTETSGDTIAASVTVVPGAGRRWRLTVRDVTTGASWSQTVSYRIAHSDADFIVEDPAINPAGRLAPFATWGQVMFSSMEVRVGQRWRPAGALRALRIDMLQHGSAKASAGPFLLGGTSFTALQN